MRTPALQSVSGSRTSHESSRRWLIWGLVSVALGLGGGGCGPSDLPDASPEEVLGVVRAEEQTDNGLSTNGLSTNGLSTNGLSTNGLSTNGLSTNGFKNWFNQDPATADAVMEYIVRCALPAGQTRTFTSTVTGVTYTWPGALGLAPGWTNGSAASTLEQEVVSACLAAHANKYGVHIPISVLGRTAQGAAIPYTSSELTTFSEKEACFFGNLFDGSGIYAANDGGYLTAKESTARACGLTSSPTTSECPPIVHVGACSTLCDRAYSGKDTLPYYTTCTYNGHAYQAITTRIRPQEIYKCGDGTCQLTEHCGTGTTYDSCKSDCGTCSSQRN
ncbi:hypothetical protein JY651_34475 [Pyxidicoccus parkwayensis]|uniref:Uncharacterized protein n=1 Tax=Pyxidicoccus parkwayensis TaxID=2813578 RepID=A0ABX7NS16_9BACT|nr:hypothetical protein [Pyxidicoccus parkwaysis]QSQ20335.1 hypothetical protein JY651_34475 [Pyxidicoccus parkwaysis]